MKRTLIRNSAWTSLPDSFKCVALMKRGICWIEKVRDELNNAFWRELLDLLIEAYNIINTSLVKNQLMMHIDLTKEPTIPFMARIEKSRISYVRDILSPNGNYLCQIELQQKWNIVINFLDYMTIVRNIKKYIKKLLYILLRVLIYLQ